jgi:CBS domain-containing protein
MKAAVIMRQPVFATTPETWVAEVLVHLATNDISGMPVVERDGTVIGIVTEDDVLRAYVGGARLEALTVQDIMSRDPVTVDVHTPLRDVIQTIYDEGILRVPVVEDGRLVGIISRGDVIKALVPSEELEDPEFLIFHRHYPGVSFVDRQPTAQEHPIRSYGW